MAAKGIDTNFAWLFLYNQEPEAPIDPNRPETEGYAKRVREQKSKQFIELIQGPAGVLFERWSKELKMMNIMLLTDKSLLVDGDKNCTCNACVMIREMAHYLKLCTEADMYMRTSRNEPKQKE